MGDFESLLTENSPEARQLARQLRDLILHLIPNAREKIYSGWGVADYGFNEKGRGFLSIGPQKGYINLYFMNGIDLPDPDSLLEGTGKRLRHVKVQRAEELKRSALLDLIKAAIPKV
jgi:hypothetical protein